MKDYDSTIQFWDNIFKDIKPANNIKSAKLPEDIEQALAWLCSDCESVLDYGCGSGTMLLRCAVLYNNCRCLGIDISQQAVELAGKDAIINGLDERVSFECGGIEKLADIADDSFDAAILSNIIDNVFPEDADIILHHIHRILRPNGKLLLKLNPYLTQEQIAEWGLTELSPDFYLENDDLYLRNLKNEQWEELFSNLFSIHEYREIHFKEHGQTNRLYLLTNEK